MGLLEPTGVSPEEEAVYRALLARGSAGVTQLSKHTGLSPARLRPLLSSLASKGLVSQVTGSRDRFVPAPPGPAIKALIRHQQMKLQEVQEHSEELEREFRAGLPVDQAVRLVEVISGKDAVYERVVQLEQSAEHEVLSLSKPPYTTPSVQDPVEQEALGRGVRHRVIYDRSALELPGELAGIQENLQEGEEARVLSDLPMKLAIADRSMALLPLTVDQRDVNAAVLVHASALLDALILLFESFWAAAIPLDAALGRHESAGDAVAREHQRLIALLAAGSKDEVIARELGVAPRTLRRRIRGTLDWLGAETRFQAGYQAGRRSVSRDG